MSRFSTQKKKIANRFVFCLRRVALSFFSFSHFMLYR